MEDETIRADLLFRALAGEGRAMEAVDDAELRALADLGGQLEALGPALASMTQAEEAFSPAFAQNLRHTLLAAHPAAVQETRGVREAGRVAAHTARRVSRRMLALLALALVLAAAALAALLHGGLQTAQVGTGASPTPQPVLMDRSFAAHQPTSTHGPESAPNRAKLQTIAPPRLGTPRAQATPALPSNGLASTAVPGPVSPHLAYGAAMVPSGAGSVLQDLAPPLPPAGAYRYHLPSALPAQPGSVPTYRLHLTPLTGPEAGAIAATFAALQPISATGVLAYAGANEQLRITLSTGEVVYGYTAQSGRQATPSTPLSDARAIQAARVWLATHQLLPAQAGSLAVSVIPAGSERTVRFIPNLRPALLTTAQIPAIRVSVDSHGHVTSAQVLWATVEPAGTVAVLSPGAAATANERAAATVPSIASAQTARAARPLITVTRVTLVYRPTVQDGGIVLRPVYRFTGTLEGRPISQTVAAENPAP